jgi:hypothetical protein
MMWRSQLTADEWFGLFEAVTLERTWEGGCRALRLRRTDGALAVPASDIHWTYNITPDHPGRRGIFSWQGHSLKSLRRKANFTAGKSDDFMMHAIQPAAEACQSAFSVFVNLDSGPPVSAAQVLTAALFASYSGDSQVTRPYSDLAEVARELARASTAENDYAAYLKIGLRVLLSAANRGAVSPERLAPLAETMDAMSQDTELTDLIRQINLLPGSQQGR